MPEWSQNLRNLYFHLRYERAYRRNQKRTLYRRIRDEKKRLLEAGVPHIEIHLVTRHLTNPKNEAAKARLHNYYAQGHLFWP